METKTAAIDLQKFCSLEALEGEWNSGKTGKPWTSGGFTYATNGHLCVRLPAIPEIPDNKEAPNTASLPWDAVVTEDQWLKIDLLKFEQVDCEVCQRGEPIHRCPDCSCECENCDDGKVFKDPVVKIGSKSVNPKYLKRIQELPNALVAPDATPKEQAIPFKFDGGQGLLMPMRD